MKLRENQTCFLSQRLIASHSWKNNIKKVLKMIGGNERLLAVEGHKDGDIIGWFRDKQSALL